jgi:hypothetical protein
MGPLRTRTLLLVVAIAFTFFTLSLRAQQNQQSTVATVPSPDNCLQRSIPLTVFQRGHKRIPELNQLEIQVGNNSALATLPRSYHGSIRVLLLIDTSGSMKPLVGTSNWGVSLATAAFATDSIPPQALVAVGTFSNHLQLSPWGTVDSARAQVVAMRSQTPKGNTALYKAVEGGISAFAERQFGDVIYLVTDGGENDSAVSLGHLTETLASRGIRVFVFLVNPQERYTTPEERFGASDMEDLIEQTGGILLRFPPTKQLLTNAELSLLAKHIRTAAASPYQIDFQAAGTLNKAAKLKIDVPLDPQEFTIAYPRRLEPCVSDLRP